MRKRVSIFGMFWVMLGLVWLGNGCATSPLGRQQLSLVPDSQMNAMGAQAFDQIKTQTPVDSDPKMNSFVQCVTGPITRAAEGRVKVDRWEVVVFRDDKMVNAFALPGGKIGVYTGIFKAAKDEAQLAAVLGHEVGHVIAKHGGERVSHQLATQGGLALVDAFILGKSIDPSKRQLLLGLIGAGAQVGILLPFSRTQESESDLIGLNLMADAGFNPEESVTLWQNMIQASGGKGPPQWLSSHPASENRIVELRAHMGSALEKYKKAQAEGRRPSCGPVPR